MQGRPRALWLPLPCSLSIALNPAPTAPPCPQAADAGDQDALQRILEAAEAGEQRARRRALEITFLNGGRTTAFGDAGAGPAGEGAGSGAATGAASTLDEDEDDADGSARAAEAAASEAAALSAFLEAAQAAAASIEAEAAEAAGDADGGGPRRPPPKAATQALGSKRQRVLEAPADIAKELGVSIDRWAAAGGGDAGRVRAGVGLFSPAQARTVGGRPLNFCHWPFPTPPPQGAAAAAPGDAQHPAGAGQGGPGAGGREPWGRGRGQLHRVAQRGKHDEVDGVERRS
jgi:pyruvate/2-oxoglutarate dehydrogenase complex dihydrolipoamide acyltransferase (E2) component